MGAPTPTEGQQAMHYRDDFALMNDSALLSWRAQTRSDLERLPPGEPGGSRPDGAVR